MTETRVPAGVPTGGQFATSIRAESSVALIERPTPIHPVESLRPDAVTHVALGPGREWGSTCGEQDCGEPIYGDEIGTVNSARAVHVHAEHRRPEDVLPLRINEWVTSEKDGFRISFTDIGEGYHGEYDPEDPDDAFLLRLDLQVRPEHPLAGDPDDDAGWHWMEANTSLCTNVRTDHVTPEQLRRLANLARTDLRETAARGDSLGAAMDRVATMRDTDAPAEPWDEPSVRGEAEMLSLGFYDSGTATSVQWCDGCESHAGHDKHGDPWRKKATGSDLYCLKCNDNQIAAL